MSELERLAREAAAGAIGLNELVAGFLDAKVIMPSATNPTEAVTPVLTDAQGTECIVVAASEEGLDRTKDMATFAFTLRGRDVVAGLAPQFGIVVNTVDGAFAIPSDTLATMRERANAGGAADSDAEGARENTEPTA